MEENTIKELLELRNDYEQEKEKLNDKKEALIQKKKEIYDQATESIKREIEQETTNARLQRYLESTPIRNINFLSRSLEFMAGNNEKGRLTFYELLLLNEEVRKIAAEYNVSSENIFNIFCKYSYYHIEHPFLENEKVQEAIIKVQYIAYLDDIFNNIDNILAYQGSYVVYRYVKNYLSNVLKEEYPQTDNELIYKDYDEKVEIVKSNLIDISSYLLEIMKEIPHSRSALCNQSLKRMSRKKSGTAITFEQNVFAKGIAFGTTLEKLQEGNYEDAKSLIYIPHQKLLK